MSSAPPPYSPRRLFANAAVQSSASLSISKAQDDPTIKTKYRPFVRHYLTGPEDWTDSLELDRVTIIAQADMEKTEPRVKVLVLYGSLRKRSYSELAAYEAARILHHLGCDVRIFHPSGLPIRDSVDADHSVMQELRQHVHVWCSPDQHGNLTAVFKHQIDWIPLSKGSMQPTQGRTLVLLQINGGSQSFNTVNSLRVLGRWMRMFTIPNQSSIPTADMQFENEEEDGSGQVYRYYARTWVIQKRQEPAITGNNRLAIVRDTGDAVPPVYCGLPPKALERRTFKKVERLGKFNDPRHILLQCEGEMIHSGGDLIGAQAGWAVQFGPATHDTIRGVLEDYGPFGNKGDATRQRATLRAVLAALRGRTWWTDECKSIVIATSDEITVDAAINWLEIWSAAGWETQWENQVKVPVPNRDLWIMLLGECDRYHENGTEISLLLTSKDYNPHLLDLATGYDALRHPQRFFIDVYIDDF
ncbi:hypothetical protein G7054_g5438 [Neopestalotiopsis clavispora]|nr:hypothetical protein G7054_g5438 [Neopestalotiopsis clavispora]